MKRGVAILLLLLACATLYWYGRSTRSLSTAPRLPLPATPAPETVTQKAAAVSNLSQDTPTTATPALTVVTSATSIVASNPGVPAAAELRPLPPELASLPPVTILENMRTAIRQYGSAFGGNPVGTNPEITRALQGDNPKQINFLKADGNRVNGNGELVDPWGTPYFFHQLSGTEMEIRSAGPDRRMWTADDLVIK